MNYPHQLNPLPKAQNDDLDIELVPEDELYPWATDNNEKRRAFIFEYFGWNNDIDANIQIKALKLLEQWLKG